MACKMYKTNEIELRKVSPGDYFKRKVDAKDVYVKGHYDKSTKSFCCWKFHDVNNTMQIKASKKVFVNFDF